TALARRSSTSSATAISPPRVCRSPGVRCSTPLPGPARSAWKPCRAVPASPPSSRPSATRSPHYAATSQRSTKPIAPISSPAPRARLNRRPAMTDTQPSVTLPNGEAMPAFGQGTWHMGEDRRRAAAEEAAVKLGIELGINLIDTAEMYGNGGAEEIVARAVAGVRDRLFIVSKVLPYNAAQKGVIEA